MPVQKPVMLHHVCRVDTCGVVPFAQPLGLVSGCWVHRCVQLNAGLWKANFRSVV